MFAMKKNKPKSINKQINCSSSFIFKRSNEAYRCTLQAFLNFLMIVINICSSGNGNELRFIQNYNYLMATSEPLFICYLPAQKGVYTGFNAVRIQALSASVRKRKWYIFYYSRQFWTCIVQFSKIFFIFFIIDSRMTYVICGMTYMGSVKYNK